MLDNDEFEELVGGLLSFVRRVTSEAHTLTQEESAVLPEIIRALLDVRGNF